MKGGPTAKEIATVARALARSHGLGDHMRNLDPWKHDARICIIATRALPPRRVARKETP